MYTCWKQSQFHQWVSDFNSRSVAFSLHVGNTGKHLPGLSVGPPCSVSAVGCLLMSALSRRRYARQTFSLYDLEMQASFCSHDLSMLASVAESDYCWLLSHSVSAETRKPIYRIRRYASAVNEYSLIYNIGLYIYIYLKGWSNGVDFEDIVEKLHYYTLFCLHCSSHYCVLTWLGVYV